MGIIHMMQAEQKSPQTAGLAHMTQTRPTGGVDPLLSTLSTAPTTVTNPYKYIYIA